MKIYTMIYKCANCRKASLVYIPFKQEALINLECPNCGRNSVNPTDKEEQWELVYDLKDECLVFHNQEQ